MTTMANEIPTTIQKALDINLDPHSYGTIAEIGAGQEIARWLFQAGGAAGTIAKTISAYDMKFSDAIYGVEDGGRYVSQSRLKKMLSKEYDLVVGRVAQTRPDGTRFFAIADTVAAQGFKGNRKCHGWMGIRLQLEAGAPTSDIIIHVRMLDRTNREQQIALGKVGINLIYAAYFYFDDPVRLVESLVDNVGSDRIEVDMIEVSGGYLDNYDNRLLALQLVKSELTDAVMFAPDGVVLNAADVLYKKDILVLRGSFRPVTHVNLDMAKCSRAQFATADGVDPEKIFFLTEITMANLKGGGKIETPDFLSRIDVLSELGFNVMISNFGHYPDLGKYFSRYTKRAIGLVLGIENIFEIFAEDEYSDLEGGMMEAFGRLFTERARLYVYPKLSEEGALISADELQMWPRVQHLYRHFLDNKFIEPIEGCDPSLLNIRSQVIMEQLKKGDDRWREGVTEEVYTIITQRNLFGVNGAQA